MEFEVELYKLEQTDLEGISCGDCEEEENVLDDLLEEGVVVDGQFTIDIRGLTVLVHPAVLIIIIHHNPNIPTAEDIKSTEYQTTYASSL